MGRYVKKNLRGNWQQKDLQAALNAVAQGKKVNTASKEFKIPRRTLKRYIAKKQSVKAHLGRRTLLLIEQENELASRIKRLASVGYPITPKFLRMSVYDYCKLNKINIPRPTEGKHMIGRDWLSGFIKRHADISLRKSQKLNPARAQKLNKFVVKDYFEKLQETITKLDIQDKPGQIYNIDEKGCQLMLHKSPQVLAEKGVKRVHILASEHAENVTIVSCGNALGNAIPPMVLFKGKRMKPEWQDNLPPGSLVAMTAKGSMNTETFIKWIEHFAKFKTPGACLLIFDGASSHLDYDIVDVAEKHSITLFCLPSNTTHELQPMDKAVFRAFEHYWDEELLKFWYQNKNKTLTKQRFGRIFTPVWDKALTPSNIKSGFEATGIFPFDPEKIPECAYAPSIPTCLPPSREQDNSTENTAIINAASDLDNEEFDSEDDIPLSLMKSNMAAKPSGIYEDPGPSTSTGNLNDTSEISFTVMMKTPEKVSSNTTPRRKAINSLAQQLTKSMFSKKDCPISYTPSAVKGHQLKKKTMKQVTKVSESWYCFLCKEDRVADMRLCTFCASYVHEECVGITSSDKELYVCPKCEL